MSEARPDENEPSDAPEETATLDAETEDEGFKPRGLNTPPIIITDGYFKH